MLFEAIEKSNRMRGSWLLKKKPINPEIFVNQIGSVFNE